MNMSVVEEAMRIEGKKVIGNQLINDFNPFDNSLV